MRRTTELGQSDDRAGSQGEPTLTTHHRIAANIASNYVALGSQVAFLLLMTPYVIDRLGTRTFGGWAIVLSVAGYLRLLDLGMSPATARFVAGAKSSAVLSAVVDTTLTVLVGVALLALGLALGVAFASPALFPHIRGLRSALFVAGASTAFQIPLATFGSVLFGLQKIAERNVAIVLRVLGSAAAVVVAVEFGGHLLALVTAIAIVEVIVVVAQAAYCLRAVPGLELRFPAVDRPLLRELGGFSFAILGLSVATQLAFYSDGIVIGVALTATAVAVYTIAMRVVDGTSQLLGQFADVFMPVFSRAHTYERNESARKILDLGTRVTLALGYPLIALLIGLGQPLIVGWVGKPFAGSWGPLALLAGGLAFGAPLRFSVLWAIAAARHRRIALYAVLDSLANLGLSIALVGPLGINGVALATLVALAVSNGWLMPRVIYSALGMSLWQSYYRPMIRAAAAVAPFVLLMRLAVSPLVDHSLGLAVLASLIWLAVGIPIAGVAVFTSSECRAARDALRRRVAHHLSN